MRKLILGALIIVAGTFSASAQHYGGRGYAYPGRGYYSGGGHYSEQYGRRYAPRVYARPSYAPPGGYHWYGGPPEAYLGGPGRGWGHEW